MIDEEKNCGNQTDLTVNVLRAALVFLDPSTSLFKSNGWREHREIDLPH